MSSTTQNTINQINIWREIQKEAEVNVRQEPILASFLHETILNHNTFQDALSFHLANKLDSPTLPSILLREVIQEAFNDDSLIVNQAVRDIKAVRERDPAAKSYSTPFLYFKGFHAIQSYRVANWLWKKARQSLALCLQSRMSEIFGVDIHPAARIGCGVLMDHATGVVVGETAVIEDNVSLLHSVTLGGTGKETGDRHPKVREGVLIGVGSKILGNIEIGAGAKVGAGSVVLSDVPAHCTVAGVPARIIGKPKVAKPALEMNHQLPQEREKI